MCSAPLQVLRAQIQGAQFTKIFRPQAGEFIQQLRQRSAFALALLSPAVEGLEAFCLTKLQDHLRSRHPVGALAVNEMSDDVERAPSFFTFIGERPGFRQIAQQCIESRGSASQQRYSLVQVMLHRCPQAELALSPRDSLRK